MAWLSIVLAPALVPAPVAAATLEEIVVTGQRLALQRSLRDKRASHTVLDKIGADDLGALTDRNLAEAVDRVAGVSLTFDQGEGRFVAIRGLNSSLNHFTIDGMAGGSPELEGGGRRVPLDVIGGELVEGVEVIKVPTPDMDAQGIGGTINVRLGGPFERTQQPSTSASLRVGHDELNDGRPYGGELTSVHVNDARTWGWLFGVSHSSRRSETRGIYQDEWDPVHAVDGTAAVIPRATMNALYDIERRRSGAHATIEWRPTALSRYFVRGFFSALDEDEVRLRHESFFREDPQTVTPTSGVANASELEQDLRFEHKDKRFLNFAIGGSSRTAGAWQVDYTAHLNDNEQTLPSRNWSWRAQDQVPSRWRIDPDGLVDATAAGAGLAAADFAFVRFASRAHSTRERSYVAALDLRRDSGAEGSFLKSGIKAARTDRSHDTNQKIHAPGTSGWTLAQLGRPAARFINHIEGRSRSNLAVDLAAADDFFSANANNGRYFQIDERETFAAQLQADYRVREQVLAAYAMTNWGFAGGNFIVGLRAEHTDVRSAGFELDRDTMQASPTKDRGRYTSVLPTVSARFDLTEQIVLRAAWTHTIGRPDYDQLAPISILERDGDTALLRIGNPDLQARRSENRDLVLEWYVGRDTLLSVSAFRKRIDDEIVERFRAFDDFTFNGETFERFTIATTQNASSADVRGVELSYQDQFDNLPAPFDGLGVALSYAALDSRARVTGRDDSPPLARQPDWTRSAALFYQKADFELALTFAETDGFLAEIADEPLGDVYARQPGRMDLRASYSLREGFGLFLEWHNLNAKPTYEYQGGVGRYKTLYEVYGQTWYVGFRAQL